MQIRGPTGETFETEYGEDLPPSLAVVTSVAAVTGDEPADLPPLYDYVDPDALEALVGSTGRGGDPARTEVTFPFGGCTVTVRGDGTIAVAEDRIVD